MAADLDHGAEGRRSRRRVRVRKLRTTAAAATSTAIRDVEPDDDIDLSAGAVTQEPRSTGAPHGSKSAVHFTAAPVLASEDIPEMTATQSFRHSKVVDGTAGNEVPGVARLNGTDNVGVLGSSQPVHDDSLHLDHDAVKKSRTKRRTKVRDREASEPDETKTASSEHHAGTNDWFNAVFNADIAAVRRLTKSKRVDVNCSNEDGKTALHIAVEKKEAELIDVLVSARGIDVNRRNADGETPLYASVRASDTTTVSRLLDAGADPNATRSNDGSCPLHCACQNGDASDLVVLLLDRGARADAGRRSARSGVTGITPLHDASDVGDARSVAELLNRDETLADAVTDRGCTGLHVASRHGYVDVVKHLLAHNAYVGQPGADSRGLAVQPLHLAAENGREETVRTLLAAGADANSTREFSGKTGVTPLHLAVMHGHVNVASILLDAGAVCDAADEDGATALHVAARGGCANAARLLLQYGAVIDATTCQQRVRRRGGGGDGFTVGRAFGQTPLHFAVRYRHLDVAAVLLEAGTDVNAAEQMYVDQSVLRRLSSQSEAGKSVPLMTTFKNCSSPVKTLESGTTAHLVSGYTALHWAVENDDRDAVQQLLDAGSDVNRAAAFDAHAGVTPLHLAAQDGRADIAADLLRHGALRDPRKSTRNRENITPLHQAVYNSQPATVAVLLEAGSDPNVQADNGYTALHYAAQKGSAEMTRAIVDAPGCDVTLRATARDQQDITALHLAVQSGSVDVVRALVAAGAPIDAGKRMAGGISGVTALHQAVYQEREEVVAALLSLGADPARSMDGWYTPLHVAAEKGCMAIGRRLVEAISEGERKRSVDERASVGEHVDLTPLHVAAQHGHRGMVKLLLDFGADMWAVRGFADRSSITALHLAAENGFADAVAALLERTATSDSDGSPFIDAQDSLGFTSLHLAVQYQFVNVVRSLLVAGADASLRTNDGLTARRIAELVEDDAILQVLGPEPAASALRTNEPFYSSLPHAKQKSSKLRSLLCGMNKH